MKSVGRWRKSGPRKACGKRRVEPTRHDDIAPCGRHFRLARRCRIVPHWRSSYPTRSDMPYASHPEHFSDDRLPAAVDGWFDAMAALHRAAPWREGPHVPCPVFVTIGSRGLLDVALQPFERDGAGQRGFALLQGPDDLEAWRALEGRGRLCGGRVAWVPAPRADVRPGGRRASGCPARARTGTIATCARRCRRCGPSTAAGNAYPGDVDDLIIAEAVARGGHRRALPVRERRPRSVPDRPTNR